MNRMRRRYRRQRRRRNDEEEWNESRSISSSHWNINHLALHFSHENDDRRQSKYSNFFTNFKLCEVWKERKTFINRTISWNIKKPKEEHILVESLSFLKNLCWQVFMFLLHSLLLFTCSLTFHCCNSRGFSLRRNYSHFLGLWKTSFLPEEN